MSSSQSKTQILKQAISLIKRDRDNLQSLFNNLTNLEIRNLLSEHGYEMTPKEVVDLKAFIFDVTEFAND